MSKQDFINFYKNGTLSKEFIASNRKELENYIKQRQRSQIDENYSLSTGLNYNSNQRAEGSHLAIPEDNQAAPLNLDVKPDKKFKSTEKVPSAKVLENWINQTLTDAEHLDIPSVILKPKNQIPLTRYGIDRLLLTSKGVDSQNVDRIYRSLFVYSVGFYELLKQQMSNVSEENSLQLLMNIWKTYGVLLEYSCRTEYRLLISRVTS